MAAVGVHTENPRSASRRSAKRQQEALSSADVLAQKAEEDVSERKRQDLEQRRTRQWHVRSRTPRLHVSSRWRVQLLTHQCQEGRPTNTPLPQVTRLMR